MQDDTYNPDIKVILEGSSILELEQLKLVIDKVIVSKRAIDDALDKYVENTVAPRLTFLRIVYRLKSLASEQVKRAWKHSIQAECTPPTKRLMNMYVEDYMGIRRIVRAAIPKDFPVSAERLVDEAIIAEWQIKYPKPTQSTST